MLNREEIGLVQFYSLYSHILFTVIWRQLYSHNNFAQERKDIFGRRDVVESFRFQPTLIVLFLKQIEFYYKF